MLIPLIMRPSKWTTHWSPWLYTIIQVYFVSLHHIWQEVLLTTSDALDYKDEHVQSVNIRFVRCKEVLISTTIDYPSMYWLHAHKHTHAIKRAWGGWRLNHADLHLQWTTAEDRLRGGWEDLGRGLCCWRMSYILAIDTRLCHSIRLSAKVTFN